MFRIVKGLMLEHSTHGISMDPPRDPKKKEVDATRDLSAPLRTARRSSVPRALGDRWWCPFCDFFRWQSPWKYIWSLWTIIYHYKSKRSIYNDFYMFIKPIHIHLTIPESTVNHRIQPLMSQLRYLGGPILCHYHGRRCFGQWWIIDEPYSDDIFLAQFPSNKSLA